MALCSRLNFRNTIQHSKRSFYNLGETILNLFGYKYSVIFRPAKHFTFVATLLVCYLIVSVHGLSKKDFWTFVINFIWTGQIILGQWVNHKEYILEQQRIAEEIKKAKNTIYVGTNQVSPWFRRFSIYCLIIFCSVLCLIILGFKSDIWFLLEGFSITTYLIAFLDGCIEVYVGIFRATVE